MPSGYPSHHPIPQNMSNHLFKSVVGTPHLSLSRFTIYLCDSQSVNGSEEVPRIYVHPPPRPKVYVSAD